ncbi:2-oxoglutarate dehydrogenase, E2 component, dihydrolipoamide succinyltransferase [Corynebacterium freneyi]|uniref:Dihydrolipoamide acetyltransferase component of pyruvate dehydrogenase complex n=2 Tax=Corynebacterium TaxID=1716 RepID=A0ABS4U6D7_9CORY|nr:2-oxoglutarate dehydrogenase, E2 component, dihydrolipoamide succinyltransferase [Corynebacterium freneyi]MBP2332200.1 2-oxoglutarate dehydrogenase E2 component (dihydrolipoamide succinyltransferase) [Corynebacterium freneyi]QXA53584.1 2-oxoglutarate dehydrogenase, E2 component, dihydrolipoamide succinyltransferase [Corynebacterium freneyi]WJZ05689.1 Dihydrolipoyllysine-residue acetyltransferase component of pyruvate dehydrogenase complex [Corynebacterium freneyi]
MATSVEMPELGESVTEGTITTWLKKVGDTVEVDEPLLEVSTDKVDTEIPSPVAGVLLEILAEEDDTVDVGAVIAKIGDADEADDSGSDDAEDEADEPAEDEQKDDEAEEKDEKPKKSGGSGGGKATDVEMPELGESVTEGTITAWLKEVGDTVEVDEPLLEVSTDKVDTEIPSPVAGTLVEVLAEVDDTVDVGAVIARIGDADAAASDDSDDSDDDEDVPSEEAIEEAESKDDNATVDEAEEKDEKPKKSGGSGGKASDVEMPELGESVTEGTITAWLKEVGDTVEVDEPLLEVSTDKVDTEIPSPVAGTLVEVLFDVDDTVDVGAVIARVGDADAADGDAEVAAAEAEAEKKAEPEEPKKEAPKKEAKAAKAEQSSPKKDEPKQEAPKKEEPKKESEQDTSGNADVPYVTPLVRKLADKHGVDLSKVEGSGIGGRIRKQDVLKAAEAGSGADKADESASSNWSTKGVRPELAELRGTTQRVNRIREITAAKTLESLQTSAQLTQLHEVDMTEVWELRAEKKAEFQDKHGVKLTFLPFFAKAVVEALVSHPNVNASWDENKKEITYHEKVNLGIAVDTERGLLSPVIHDAQDMSLPELAAAIVDIADRARNNKLKPNDLSGGTFTITNIGSEGALSDTPILVPPQGAMIGTGVIKKRPVVVTENGNDAIGIRAMAYLPITYDHRLIDGADAGRFMTTVVDRLQVADFQRDLGL